MTKKLRLTTICEECGKKLKKPLLFEDKFQDGERSVLLCYSCYSWLVDKAGNVPPKKQKELELNK